MTQNMVQGATYTLSKQNIRNATVPGAEDTVKSAINHLTSTEAIDRAAEVIRAAISTDRNDVTDDDRVLALTVIAAAIGPVETEICGRCSGAGTTSSGPWGSRPSQVECTCNIVQLSLIDEISGDPSASKINLV